MGCSLVLALGLTGGLETLKQVPARVSSTLQLYDSAEELHSPGSKDTDTSTETMESLLIVTLQASTHLLPWSFMADESAEHVQRLNIHQPFPSWIPGCGLQACAG